MTDGPPEEETFICRCEDITLRELKNAIDDGLTDLDELRRYLKFGFGICQGRFCMTLIANIIAQETKQPIQNVVLPRTRPPLRPVPYYLFESVKNEREK